MVRRASAATACVTVLFAAGCAISPNSDLDAFAEASGANSFEVWDRSLEPQEALVLPVGHDRQYEGPACGAHVLASVVNYWRGPGALDGADFYAETPPASPAGYSMAELLNAARAQGLLASAVRLPEVGLIAEIERGRPVVTPVRLPSIYVQQRVMPGAEVPVLGVVRNTVINRTGRLSEWLGQAMVDHYLLVVGYEEDTFVVVEPVMGYRTLSARRLARYREAFDDAAIVFSAPAEAPQTLDGLDAVTAELGPAPVCAPPPRPPIAETFAVSAVEGEGAAASR